MSRKHCFLILDVRPIRQKQKKKKQKTRQQLWWNAGSHPTTNIKQLTVTYNHTQRPDDGLHTLEAGVYSEEPPNSAEVKWEALTWLLRNLTIDWLIADLESLIDFRSNTLETSRYCLADIKTSAEHKETTSTSVIETSVNQRVTCETLLSCWKRKPLSQTAPSVVMTDAPMICHGSRSAHRVLTCRRPSSRYSSSISLYTSKALCTHTDTQYGRNHNHMLA